MPPETTDGHGGGDGVGAMRRIATGELSADELRGLRSLMDASFASFDDDDWVHALGGIHVIVEKADVPVSHAAVVERVLGVDGRMLRTGYVEAVCTALAHRGRGHASAVMREVGHVIRERYELGALGTGIHGFYARFGWERWEGPTSVRTVSGREPTPKNDGGIMILRTAATERLDLRGGLSCEWRAGSVW
jgi:aminoglycoside 2'-N-acetyltransferase I